MTPEAMSRRFSSDPDEVPAARHAVVEYARDHGAIDLDGIAMAVTEAVTNAVIHSRPDMTEAVTIEVTAERHPGNGLEIVVTDDGHGVRPRLDSPGLGLGLSLIASLAQDMALERGPGGGTRVRMVFAAR